MSISNTVLIAAVEARTAIEDLPEGTSLEDRARAAFNSTKNSWILTREEEQYMAGCEALTQTASDEEKERILDELRRAVKLNSLLNAMQQGIPVDIEAMAAEQEIENETRPAPIGLQKLWREVTAR